MAKVVPSICQIFWYFLGFIYISSEIEVWGLTVHTAFMQFNLLQKD